MKTVAPMQKTAQVVKSVAAAPIQKSSLVLEKATKSTEDRAAAYVQFKTLQIDLLGGQVVERYDNLLKCIFG